jgi:hypothetical protein
MDVSADLTELGRTPVAVICAGAKSILDIPRTLEYLETQVGQTLYIAMWFACRQLTLPAAALHSGMHYLMEHRNGSLKRDLPWCRA